MSAMSEHSAFLANELWIHFAHSFGRWFQTEFCGLMLNLSLPLIAFYKTIAEES